MPWKCFVAQPSPFVRRSLRRYQTGPCAASGISYHNAEVVVDAQYEAPPGAEGGSLRDKAPDHPAWPKVCACGYRFDEQDHWQVNVERLYAGSLDGRLYTLKTLPPGAMWRPTWLEDREIYCGPDGGAWCLKLPGGGEWLVYGPTAEGEHWQITGQPPLIDVHPSINQPGSYHGHVKAGVLSEDSEGRPFAGVPRTA